MTTINGINQEDFNKFIETKDNITQQTKDTYEDTLRRFIKIILNNDKRKIILKQKKQFLKDTIDNLEASINSKIQYAQLYNNMYFVKHGRNSPLSEYTKELYKQNIEHTHDKTKNDLEKNNITYEDLKDMLDNAEGQDYITLYILINFNVRNNDLIFKFKNKYSKDKNNIIYIDGNEAVYIRRDYKTSDRYGEKKHIIKDKKFIDILKDKEINEYVLRSRTNKPYVQKEISNYIKFLSNRLIDKANLNQQIIYKIIVRHYEQINDHKKLKDIAKNRGHSLDTQATSYSTGE